MPEGAPRVVTVSSLTPKLNELKPSERPRLEFGDLLAELKVMLRTRLQFDFEHLELINDDDVELLDELRRQVRDSTDTKVVHLIGHGEVDGSGGDGFLHIVPPSGRLDDRTALLLVCAAAQSACAASEDRELLMVIDVCHAGAAVDRLGLEQLNHVWIAAAATPSGATYDGMFTRAFTATLNDIADGETNTDPGEPYVSMQTFRDLFSTHLRRLGINSGRFGPRPKLIGKFSDALNPPSSIFPNLNYDSTVAALRQERARVDQSLHEYLDDGLDVGHFDDRVGAHFTGRRSVLRDLGSWIVDTTSESGEESTLRVITGSGGVGKSAILGAIVLTQHPQVRAVPAYKQIGQTLRSQYRDALNYAAVPFPFAAVHARQLRVDQITASIARQLGAQVAPEAIPKDPTPDSLLAALAALPEPPLILVDALDEASGPDQVVDTLLRAILQHAPRADGRPICRLLVACRNETAPHRRLLGRLERAATRSDSFDLDQTPAEELRDDLFEFMHKALSDHDGQTAPEIKRIATAVATTLTEVPDDGDPDHHRHSYFGAFLVANFFSRYLRQTDLVSQPDLALATIPRSPPQVLEMDLLNPAYESSPSNRRSILAALAHARGQGMPASIAGLLAREVFNGTQDLDASAVLTRTSDVKIYVRTAVDPSSGETLYRLFHQALVDHMLRYPRNPPPAVQNL